MLWTSMRLGETRQKLLVRTLKKNEQITRVRSQAVLRGAESGQPEKAVNLYRKEKLIYAVRVQQESENAERGKKCSRRESEIGQWEHLIEFRARTTNPHQPEMNKSDEPWCRLGVSVCNFHPNRVERNLDRSLVLLLLLLLLLEVRWLSWPDTVVRCG